MDSRENVDCHAVQAPLAMTEKNAASKKVDSRFLTTTPKFERAADSQTLQAEGFCDDFLKKPASALPCTAAAGFGGFQGGGEGIYLSGNEQASAAESAKSAQKPTPKPKKEKL